ncbi:sialidase family protein [Thalassoglobus polymorphus]|uniref:BNR/Asp-box repeat protein n=1 Tax=Thalassoglobus polymorphus TaxID=2527994 RepID=A0A517QM64_9PLAN|nr:sialidase family protein [Thalassoglobus polymorphus]QDT32720.1 BNR/Asp-box repeat protein [Thalassoglobus polymorphus]
MKHFVFATLVCSLIATSVQGEVFLVKKGEPQNAWAQSKEWKTKDGAIEGHGLNSLLLSERSLKLGPFQVDARLRLIGQEKSAATFQLGNSHFGFEGAAEEVFVNGPIFGDLKFIGNPDDYFESEDWFDFQVISDGKAIRFLLNGKEAVSVEDPGTGFDTIAFRPWRSTMQIADWKITGNLGEVEEKAPRGYTIPTLDLADQKDRQVIVDIEKGQYLGHPTTVLLEDGKTILCVYPKGHGRGPILYKRSLDGGLTWSDRLPTPENWATSKETPTLHPVVDAQGNKRLIMWSGLYPARLAVSEDDGKNWSPLKIAGDWGGIVVMGTVMELKTPGQYIAFFHDDGRFMQPEPKQTKPATFTLYKTFSNDGGLTWSFPEAIFARSDVHLCEPGGVRSPDGKQIAVLLRENRRLRNSYVIFSNDEGKTWTDPKELPASLTGDRHTAKYTPDGRLFISFRDRTLESPTPGDWVAWVGKYEDIAEGREGQYRVRLMDNKKGADCAYPGVEVLPDGTIVTTTYGHWTEGEQPYIVSVRLKLEELDQMAEK